MFPTKLILVACVLIAVSASERENLLGLRHEDISHDIFKRASPPDDYRNNNGYYSGVYDNYYNNPFGYKRGDYNPTSYNPGYYNSRLYNRRNYPSYYDGSPQGPHNPGYYSGYYNNTRYPYGNYQDYHSNYPNPYQNYLGYQGYNTYNPGRFPAYNDRFNNQGYYQGGFYNNPATFNRDNYVETSKSQ